MARALLLLMTFSIAAACVTHAAESGGVVVANPNAELVNLDPPPTESLDSFSPLTSYKNKTVAECLARLKTRDNPSQLKQALEALSEMCAPPQMQAAAVDDLLLAQKEIPDVDTQRLAILALGRIGAGAQSAEPRLITLLANPAETPIIRAAACRALIQISPESMPARDTILAATMDRNADVRHEAFEALIILAMPAQFSETPVAVIPEIIAAPNSKPDPSKPKSPGAPKSVPRIGTFPYPLALEALAKAALVSRTAEDADAALRTIGEPGMQPLLHALTSGTPFARAAAAETLSGMHTLATRAFPALISAARKEVDRHAREAEVFAAAALNPRDPIVLGLLVESLGVRPDPFAPLRINTAEGFMLNAGREALPALRKALQSERAATRLAALKILAQWPVPEVSDIAARLRDRDDEIRIFAAQTLKRMGPAAASAADELRKAISNSERGEVSKSGKNAALEFQRIASIAMLNIFRAPTAPVYLTPFDGLSLEQLLTRLAAKESTSRDDAALALRLHLTDAATIDALETALNDSDPKVRRASARALGACPAPSAAAISSLAQWLESEPKSRIAALEALGELGAKASGAANALTKLTAEDVWPEDAEFTKLLTRALRPHAEIVVPALIGYIRSGSPEVRARAASALGLLGPAASGSVSELVDLAQSSDESEARAAFEALRLIGPEKDPGAIPFLSSVIRESLFASRRLWAVRALGLSRPGLDADTPERNSALVAALFDGDETVCSAASEALTQSGDQATPLLVEVVLRGRSPRTFWPLKTLAALHADPAFVVPRMYAHTLPGNPPLKRAMAIESLSPYAAQNPQVASILLRALRSREVPPGHAAINALGPIMNTVRPDLQRMLFDRDPAVRKAAAETLNRY